MNLMFWKKKTDVGSDAEAAHDDADDMESARHPADDEAHGEENPDQEEQETRGTMMRLKDWFAASVYGSKKPEASTDEADAGGEADAFDKAASHEPHKSRGHADADEESADSPQPENAGLAARIKARFAVLKQRFRKAPTPDAEEEEAEERPSEKAGRSAKAEPEHVPEEAVEESPRRARNYLLISSVTVMLIVVLTGSGFVFWKVFFTHPVQHPVTPGTTDPALVVRAQVVPRNAGQQAEIEALRKNNEELQAQLDALKRAPPQMQQPVQPAYRARSGAEYPAAGGNAPPPPGSEVAIGAKDAQTSAQGLKEAIEAMNASGKPRK